MISLIKRFLFADIVLVGFVTLATISVATACSSSDANADTATVEPARQALVATLEFSPVPTATATSAPTIIPTASPTAMPTATATVEPTNTATPTATATPTHPLMIEVIREQEFPGSELTFKQTLESGSNYDRYIVTYESEGNTINALFTAPWGEPPETGWPVIIFNHGWIRPDNYATVGYYQDYIDALAQNRYIVFASDYRGHGASEGEARVSYSSPAYTIDVLNGLAAVKTYPDTDPERIGIWGHSMGGHLSLRAMVVSDEFDAGVFWSGVVVSYPDLFERWRHPEDGQPTSTPDPTRQTYRRWRDTLDETYGTPAENPDFWASISANSYLSDLSGPLQLHHSTTDTSVPVEFSEILYEEVQAVGKPVELYLYEGDNHNIFANFWTAMQRTIDFFDEHVKGAG